MVVKHKGLFCCFVGSRTNWGEKHKIVVMFCVGCVCLATCCL